MNHYYLNICREGNTLTLLGENKEYMLKITDFSVDWSDKLMKFLTDIQLEVSGELIEDLNFEYAASIGVSNAFERLSRISEGDYLTYKITDEPVKWVVELVAEVNQKMKTPQIVDRMQHYEQFVPIDFAQFDRVIIHEIDSTGCSCLHAEFPNAYTYPIRGDEIDNLKSIDQILEYIDTNHLYTLTLGNKILIMRTHIDYMHVPVTNKLLEVKRYTV